MIHDYHEGLPGYNAEQILHDGCGECERRGADPVIALDHMDRPTFIRAWRRALQFSKSSEDMAISHAEAPTLRLLEKVQFHVSEMVLTGTTLFGQ